MKISFNWLQDLVTLPAGVGAGDVARRLSLAGLEVESIERRGREVTGVRIAEVRAIRPHPGAEKLRIVRLSIGGAGGEGEEEEEEEEDVVCGAPNVPAPGGRVAWAPPGATLPGGLTLGRKEIRGVSSPGMICSEKELGIGEGVDGILILSPEAGAPGADLVAALGIADDVLEVNVTPNRPDALSHAGIAREVAALFGVRWKLPEIARGGAASDGGPAGVDVEIADAIACPRYQATVIRGLHVGPSPLALRLRLAACGVRAISNLVDVTNYVMLETGHPLHAFDLDRLQAGGGGGRTIGVRRAAAGEEICTLDGVARRLEAGDILIVDGREPVALAGVMGGATSEVSASTTAVLLEAATFEPRSVRRTSKRLGLHSEASHRFERGVDAAGVPYAGARAAALMARLGGGRIAGAAVDRYPAPAEPRRVTLPAATLRSVAGFDIPLDEAAAKLGGIDIATERRGDDLAATIPSFRPDITIPEDLVEEVMRLVGYDRVPARLPAAGNAPAPSPERAADRARDVLAGLGLYEIASWAFVPRASLAALGDPALAEGIAVKNPISADYEVMRTSLLPGLAAAAARNLARGAGDLGLFEVGPVVRPAAGDEHHRQIDHAAGLLAGRRAGWLKPGDAVDFFDVARVVTELLAALGAPAVRFDSAASRQIPYLHPGVSAGIHAAAGDAAGALLGLVGEVHPAVARRLGLDVPAFTFEVYLDALGAAAGRAPRAVAPPRFPPVTRDLSFWIDTAVPAEAQRAAFASAGEALLRDLAVLEDFRDARHCPPGKKGMLWTMTYRADDRTLTDAEADAAHARVVGALQSALAIAIR